MHWKNNKNQYHMITDVSRLQQLLDSKKITSEHFNHFKSRGIEIIRPLQDFGLKSLGRVLPEIVIGASYEFVKRMKIPYQATSLSGCKYQI